MKCKYITDQKKQQLTAFRREFHEYPEQGFCEYRTSGRIAEILENLGYEVMLGREVMKPDARMGVPQPEILKAAETRALEEGLDPLKLEKMHGGLTGVIGILRRKDQNSGQKSKKLNSDQDNKTLNLCQDNKTLNLDQDSKKLNSSQDSKRTDSHKIIALRFDIDALPVEEKTGLPFASKHLGTMHACGHDGHTAVGLTVAQILAECWNKQERQENQERQEKQENQERQENQEDSTPKNGQESLDDPQDTNKLPYEIRLIFQPAEEGVRGAKAIAENGWLDDVDLFLSGHIGLGCTPVGRIQACTAGFLATTKLNLTFLGKAAHAAKNPEDGRNALLAAAEFTVRAAAIPAEDSQRTAAIPAEISQRTAAIPVELSKPAPEGLLNIGKFLSGSARNIIADKAYLELETRGKTSEINAEIAAKARQVAEEIAAKYGVTVQIEEAGSSVTAKSSPQLVENLKRAAGEMEIVENAYQTEGIMPASEDAAILMERVQRHGGQAAYFLFGTELAGDHHQSTFDFDEETLAVMAEFMIQAVLFHASDGNFF